MEEPDMLIKRIISAALILGVMAAFAVAGSPVFAACHKPVTVTVSDLVDTSHTPG
jgi:hypothetical protein